MRGRLGEVMAALVAALQDGQLRRVQLAWSTTITAEWALIVALAVWAFEAGGALGIGVLTLVRTIPAAVLGPFLAPLADRYRRELVLTAVTAVRVVLVGAIAAALLADGPTAVVYVLAAVDATSYTLYWPAQSSLLTELARRPEQLVAANVTSTTIENVGGLGGPALAAVVLSIATPGATVAVAALLLVASTATLLPLERRRRGTPVPTTDVAEGRRLLAGFGHLARTPWPRLVGGLYLSHTLALGGLTVLVAVLALDALDLGQSGVGLLTAAMGAGGIVGSLAALQLVGHPRLARTLVTGIVVWAVATALLGIAPTVAFAVALAVALLAVTGMSNAMVDVAALTLLQRVVPGRLLARVLGVVEGIWWGTLGVGGFLASVLAELVGVELALVAVGSALAALAVVLRRPVVAIDAAITVPRQRLETLLGDPILGALPPTELEQLASGAEEFDVDPGQVLVREGDVGDRYFAIVEGAVEVTNATTQVCLGPGQGFGEIALLRDVPRTATVTAVEPTRLTTVDRATFLTAVRGHQSSAAAAATLVAERAGDDPEGPP
jgi:MFS family permease